MSSTILGRYTFTGRFCCDGEGVFHATQRFVDPYPLHKFEVSIEDAGDAFAIENINDELIKHMGTPYSYLDAEEEVGYYKPCCTMLKGNTFKFEILDKPIVYGAIEGEHLGYKKARFNCHYKALKTGEIRWYCDYIDIVPEDDYVDEPVSATTDTDDF